MTTINTSILNQSQFASPSLSLNDMRTKSGAQSQMEQMKGLELRPVNHKFSVPSLVMPSELGKHVNLKA